MRKQIEQQKKKPLYVPKHVGYTKETKTTGYEPTTTTKQKKQNGWVK